MSKRNQKTRQNHHQIVFFPAWWFFLLLWLVSFVSFSRFFPPSPNHFGIATKAEAPAKKTDRDSNNSNENEIINKKKQTTTQSEASAISLRIPLQKDNSTRQTRSRRPQCTNEAKKLWQRVLRYSCFSFLFSHYSLVIFDDCLVVVVLVGDLSPFRSCGWFVFSFSFLLCSWNLRMGMGLAFLRVFLGVVFGFRIIGQDLLDFVRRLAFNQRGNFRATQMKQRRQIHVVGA